MVEAKDALTKVFGVRPEILHEENGVLEFSLNSLLEQLPKATAYEEVGKEITFKYQPFSIYPSVSRDVAMWVEEGVGVDMVEAILHTAGGVLLVRLTHLDTFTKDSRTSLAFRLVFQAPDRTLVEDEIVSVMDKVYEKVKAEGWEVR